MLHDTADEVICLFTESLLIEVIGKHIHSVSVQSHIQMHTGTIGSQIRLWHKCCMKSMPLGDGLNYQLKCHDIICCSKSFVIAEHDFVLSRCSLMVRCLNLKSHIFQSQHHVTSCIFAKVQRSQIKIAGILMCPGCRLSVLICFKQKKFALRAYIKFITV